MLSKKLDILQLTSSLDASLITLLNSVTLSLIPSKAL